MRQAYISVSFGKRKELEPFLQVLKATLTAHDFHPHIFVDKYQFSTEQEVEMMKQAMSDIENSELLIAETTHKGIGIGIEVGFAKAKGIPVLYLRQEASEHSTTVSGISDFQIIYENETDLENQLQEVLYQIKS